MQAQEVVRARWAELHAEVNERFPQLVPLVDAAASVPQLSALFPFLSIGRLCFSRCTEFPYYVDFLVSFLDPATYVAEVTLGAGGWVDTKELASGSAQEAVALIASLIPSGYGPAQLGNAELLFPGTRTLAAEG